MQELLKQYELYLLALLIFVPLERLLAARPQKVFRRGLLTDMAFLFLNGWLVMAAVIAVLALAVVINDQYCRPRQRRQSTAFLSGSSAACRRHWGPRRLLVPPHDAHHASHVAHPFRSSCRRGTGLARRSPQSPA